jgi:hypothetical protein
MHWPYFFEQTFLGRSQFVGSVSIITLQTVIPAKAGTHNTCPK